MGVEAVARPEDADHDVAAGAVVGLPALEDERTLEAGARAAAHDRQHAHARRGGKPGRGRDARALEPVRGEVAPRAPQRQDRPRGRPEARRGEQCRDSACPREYGAAAHVSEGMGGLEIARRATNGSSTHRASARAHLATIPAIEVDDLHRRFGSVEALRGVSLEVEAGEVHGILGPNGAGKTTLMRILCGVVDPSSGSAYVLDRRAGRSRELREQIGFVPSGDRSFYLRLSGLENLVFFARMHGLRRRAARERAAELLDAVGPGGCGEPAGEHVLARDAEAAVVRARAAARARRAARRRGHPRSRSRGRPAGPDAGARLARAGAPRSCGPPSGSRSSPGFAERVTVLDRGVVCFADTVAALAAAGGGDRHVIGLGPRTTAALPALDAALGSLGRLQPAADAGHALIALSPGVSLGAALSALTAAGADVTSCRDERPAMERAFLAVTGERAA